MNREEHLIVVGAGLVGSLLACYLGRRGYNVDVYERRADPRAGTAERGRSINLALSERGIDALRRIDLLEAVMAPALPMHGRMMHGVDGALAFQSYSADGSLAINSISRGALNHTLLDAAEATPGVTLHFDERLVGIGIPEGLGQVLLEFTGTDAVRTTVHADIVLGADGGGSAVRTLLHQDGRVEVVHDTLDHGYKELTIPPVDGDFAMDPDALHIWPRGASMMIALPNPDRSFTCTLFWPKEGENGFDAIRTATEIQDHFARHYPDALSLIPNLVDDYEHNPIGALGTIHAAPWQIDGRIALIGDSAHAILPFFGQGANCGFEDVVELNRCLDQTGDDWAAALPLYQERRIENAEAIAQLAKENFVEMRDKVGSKAFLATKRVEHALERLLPGVYRSRYEMVSFTTIPYAEVLRRAKRQQIAVGAAAATAAVAVLGTVLAARARRRS